MGLRDGDDRTYPLTIGTIEDCCLHDYHVRASCNGCRHHALLDLLDIGDRIGFDHSTLAVDLVPRLRCEECGGRDISLTLSYAGRMGQNSPMPR